MMLDDDPCCAHVYDTQIYAASGGRVDDSDDDFDLKMDEDSEPPADSDTDDDEPLVVTKTSKKPVASVTGGGEQTWMDLSREFIAFLASANLPA